MARLKASSQAGDLDFDMKIGQPRRARNTSAKSAGSRFDDFDDFSREPAHETAPEHSSSRGIKRRGSWLRWPESTWARCLLAGCALVFLAAVAVGLIAAQRFFLRDPRFRIASSDNIRVAGSSQVTHDDVLAVFGGDIGRNIFYVNLVERQAQLQALPWVHYATVERLLPDHLSVAITERVPVAFLSDGGSISLVDTDGVVLSMPAGASKNYSFPVLTGVGSDPAQRAARMTVFGEFIRDVDANGANVSRRISEIDLTDPEDVQATIDENGTPLAVHFGDQEFAARYGVYQRHLAEWREQYPLLASIDLRNAPQVTLGMRKAAATDSVPTTTAAAAPPVPAAVPTPPPSAPAQEVAAAPPVVTPVKLSKTTNSTRAAGCSPSARCSPVQAKKKPAIAQKSLQHAKASPAVTASTLQSATSRPQGQQASSSPSQQHHVALHMPGVSTQAGVQ